jgi:hypothetical protein
MARLPEKRTTNFRRPRPSRAARRNVTREEKRQERRSRARRAEIVRRPALTCTVTVPRHPAAAVTPARVDDLVDGRPQDWIPAHP